MQHSFMIFVKKKLIKNEIQNKAHKKSLQITTLPTQQTGITIITDAAGPLRMYMQLCVFCM